MEELKEKFGNIKEEILKDNKVGNSLEKATKTTETKKINEALKGITIPANKK